MSDTQFLVKRLTSTAKIPKRGSKQAAGYDLYADIAGKDHILDNATHDENGECIISQRGSCLVSTGLAVKIPEGYYGRIASRSGLAVKGIEVGAGVIDADYRGEVKVLLRNFGTESLKINHGDRVAQLILEKITTPYPIEVEDLDDTTRGVGGFGSTGVGVETKTNSNNANFKCSKCKGNLGSIAPDGQYYKVICKSCNEVNFVLFQPAS